MRFYEFEAKRLFAKHGIAVPQGKAASSPAEAEAIAAELGCPVTVRAQVVNRAHAASKTADSPARARELATELLALDDGRRRARGVLVEKVVGATADFSVAASYDGTRKLPVLVACSVEIGRAHV